MCLFVCLCVFVVVVVVVCFLFCFSEEEIMEETKTCYVNLYNQQETVDVNLKISAPLLTVEDREISEG